MTVLRPIQTSTSVVVERTLPLRTQLTTPGGGVIRIPISGSTPDAHTIISALQFVIEQWGRDPAVRASAIGMLRSNANNDVQRHVLAISAWVMSHMVYLADPDGAEFVQSPTVLLKQIEKTGRAYGDCDDHVVLLGSLLNAIGIPAEAVGVKLYGSQFYNHVVIQYPRNGEMVIVDPCAKDTAAPFYRERLVVR